MVLVVKNPPTNAGDVRDVGSIPGSGRSPRGGHGNLLQYSCLENLMDRGAWWATVHRVAKSWTWLKQLSMHARTHRATILTILNVQFSGIIYLHLSGDRWLCSVYLQNSSYSWAETLYPLNSFPFPSTLNSWQLPSYFVSMNQTTTGPSCKWNHTIFTFLWLTHFT